MFGFSRNEDKVGNGGTSKWRAAITISVAAILTTAATLIFLFDKPKDSWPHILQYIITNPLVLAIGATLLGFLTIERFKDISTRVSELGKQVFDISSSFDSRIRSSTDGVSKDLKAEWDRVQNKLDAIRRENPWVESISNLEITVNAPTTGAALRNIEQFLKSDDAHIAYEILYQTASQGGGFNKEDRPRRIEGAPGDFESLAFLAIALFSDLYICDLLLGRAEISSGSFSAPWKARRLIFALLNNQQSTAESLSHDMEIQLRPSTWRKLLSRFGRRVAILSDADYSESMCALAICDNFLKNEDAYRRRSWVHDETSRLPSWATLLIKQSEDLLNGRAGSGEEFVKLASFPAARTSVVLVRIHQLISEGRLHELRQYIENMASRRPGLALLRRVPQKGDSLAPDPKPIVESPIVILEPVLETKFYADISDPVLKEQVTKGNQIPETLIPATPEIGKRP